MIKKIYKYPLTGWEQGYVKVELPEWSDILETGFDPNGELCIWALVEPDNEKYTRTFMVCGTGSSVTDKVIHLASVTDRQFIWHVFEVIG